MQKEQSKAISMLVAMETEEEVPCLARAEQKARVSWA